MTANYTEMSTSDLKAVVMDAMSIRTREASGAAYYAQHELDRRMQLRIAQQMDILRRNAAAMVRTGELR